MSGEIEVDETSSGGKAVVMGVLECNEKGQSKVQAKHVKVPVDPFSMKRSRLHSKKAGWSALTRSLLTNL
ncbi:MAG: hypothetical protein EOP04_11545 [Proteobacteria bacterium]|nr:MAG: hypothetical protein EOP04_11545 [Pseudomonadota bacterium]